MQFPPELLTNCKNMNWLELAACDLCSRKIKDPITPTKALKATRELLCPPFPSHPPSKTTKLWLESQGSTIKETNSLFSSFFPSNSRMGSRTAGMTRARRRCHTRPCAWRDCHLLAHPHRWGPRRRQQHLQILQEQWVPVGSEMKQRFPAACYPPGAVKSHLFKAPSNFKCPGGRAPASIGKGDKRESGILGEFLRWKESSWGLFSLPNCSRNGKISK